MNTYGIRLKLTSAGESHGPGYVGILDGFPAGFLIDMQALQAKLKARRPGQNSVVSPRQEKDAIEIISGVFEGKTTGAPIAFLVRNEDVCSKDYSDIATTYRPGHADYTYAKKYGIRDYRGGGRSSARETVLRVAAGALAEQWLAEKGIQIEAGLTAIGPFHAETIDLKNTDDNICRFADSAQLTELTAWLDDLKQSGDSVGAKCLVRAINVPVGVGEPIFAKLPAVLASAMMSIPAVKAVAMGDGFECYEKRGSDYNDQMCLDPENAESFLSNHAGGTLGGISNGMPIEMTVHFKPTSSIQKTQQTIDESGEATTISTKGRHDPCVGIRGVSVVKAMMALVLMDLMV